MKIFFLKILSPFACGSPLSWVILFSRSEEEVNIDFYRLFACGIAIELESFSSSSEEK